MPESKWIKNEVPLNNPKPLFDPASNLDILFTQALTQYTGAPCPPIFQEVLKSKNISSLEEFEKVWTSSFKHLTDPFQIYGMDVAIERLFQAFLNKESICIYGDFDLDGTPAIALLKAGLNDLGFENVGHYQPRRLRDGYGFHKAPLNEISKNYSLVVTVDVGITAVETVEYANELGLDVIITDHHLCNDVLPPAIAIVNPNQPRCSSGLGHLCGTGVAFYLLMALAQKLKSENKIPPQFQLKNYLDCFAIATVTDLVPLVKENRILVKHGLVRLRETQRPGLRKLLEALNLINSPLLANDIAMKFAPKLNALSRLDADLLPIDLFLVQDQSEATTMVQKVLEMNEKRLALQKAAMAEAELLLETSPPTQGFIFLASPKFHKGVIGLVATQLTQKYSVPSFIASIQENDIFQESEILEKEDRANENLNRKLSGSSRRPEKSSLNLKEILLSCQEALTDSGGHAAAAGFHLTEEMAPLFQNLLISFFSQQNSESPTGDLAPNYFYDVDSHISELTTELMLWLEALEPFGVEFTRPVFKISHVEICRLTWLKETHLKLSLSAPSSVPSTAGSLDAIWFFPEKTPALKELKAKQKVDLLGELHWNTYLGQKKLQFLIKDLHVSRI